MVTGKGDNFPTLSFLPVTRHHADSLPNVTISSSSNDYLSSHSYSSALNERSHSVPETDTPAVAQPQLQHMHSSPTVATGSSPTLVTGSSPTLVTGSSPTLVTGNSSQYDEEEDFVSSDVFLTAPVGSSQGNPTIVDDNEEPHSGQPDGEAAPTAKNRDLPSLNNDQQAINELESSVNEEAAYFMLEKPSKLITNIGDTSSNVADNVSTPAYEEIDEAKVKAVERPHSPLPYEIPSVSRHESCDAYYSNIGSPETSGYTLLSQWTRCKPEDDYTQLDPSTIISKTDECLYPQLNCAVHLGKREVLEPLSEKVRLSIKEIVREIHLYLGKSYVY